MGFHCVNDACIACDADFQEFTISRGTNEHFKTFVEEDPADCVTFGMIDVGNINAMFERTQSDLHMSIIGDNKYVSTVVTLLCDMRYSDLGARNDLTRLYAHIDAQIQEPQSSTQPPSQAATMASCTHSLQD